MGAVAEILYRSYQSEYLHSAADAFLGLLDLAFEQPPEIFGLVALCIYQLILLKGMDSQIVGNQPLLLAVEYRPDCRHIFIYDFFECCFYHIYV